MSKLLRSTWLPVVVSLGLFVSLYAATPSFTSFDQTYFTTNNLRVGFRSNGVPSIVVTNQTNIVLVSSNIYVTNLYATNLYVSNIISTDLLWTNDAAGLRPADHVVYYQIVVSNMHTYGWEGRDPEYVLVTSGSNTLDTTSFSSLLIFSEETNAASAIISLSPGAFNGQELELYNYTNSFWAGQFTLPANSQVLPFGGGYVKLRNNMDWATTNGSGLTLRYIAPDWIEMDRSYFGTTNQPQEIIINPTDGRLPYRVDADEFGDSPWHRLANTNALGYNSSDPFLFVKPDGGAPSTRGTIAIGNDVLTAKDSNDVSDASTVSIGEHSLKSAFLAGGSTAIGWEAAAYATNFTGSVAVGTGSAAVEDADALTSVGTFAGPGFVNSRQDTFIGYSAGAQAGYSPASGSYSNTVVGANALYAGTGNNIVAVGAQAGSVTQGGLGIRDRSYNTSIGAQAGWNQTADLTITNAISIGFNSTATNSNEIVIGNSANTATYIPSLLGLGLGSSGTSQITFGPGVTNVLHRSASSLVYTNGANTNSIVIRNGSGYAGILKMDAAGSLDISATSSVGLTSSGGYGIGFSPNGSFAWQFDVNGHMTPSSSATYNIGVTDDGTISGAKNVAALRFILSSQHTPANSSETNFPGALAYDDNYVYVWTATNVNKRIPLNAW